MRQLSRMLLIAILSAASPCLAETMPDSSPLPAELLQAIDAFYGAIESDDVEARIALFDDDFLMLPNHWTMSRGKESIAASLRSYGDSVFRIRNRRVVDSDASGHLAYVVNAYEYSWHAVGDEPQWHRTKNVHLWRKGADGAWRLHADIWNSDVRLSEFESE